MKMLTGCKTKALLTMKHLKNLSKERYLLYTSNKHVVQHKSQNCILMHFLHKKRGLEHSLREYTKEKQLFQEHQNILTPVCFVGYFSCYQNGMWLLVTEAKSNMLPK